VLGILRRTQCSGSRYALQVSSKPVEAVQRAKELAGTPKSVCVVIIHAKFFNFAKDPFAATLFKAVKVGVEASSSRMLA
jgi:hypothetical protein